MPNRAYIGIGSNLGDRRANALEASPSRSCPPSPLRPSALERFEREARAIAALNRPGICSIYDVGKVPVPYLVMELLDDGATLHHRLARGPMDVATLVETARAISSIVAPGRS